MLDKMKRRFGTESPPKVPPKGEVATTADGRDITRGYISGTQLLAPQDSVLRARGGNFSIYDEVLRDEQVKMALDQRQSAVISCSWEVSPGGTSRSDRKAADFLEAQLKALNWDRITRGMLWGVFYGYAVGECLFARDGVQVILDDIKVRDRRRFAFDGAQRLRLLTSSNSSPGELLPDAKFWAFQTGATHDDEPYGLGLAHWLYWPVFFKRNGLKFWLNFLEKFGTPTVVGTYHGEPTQEQKNNLLAACAAVSTDSAIIVPEGMQIELIEATRRGAVDYVSLWDQMNDAIAKAVLGQVMTSEAKGGQYKSEIQMQVRQDFVKADADLVSESFNLGPARWLTAWNFPDAALPQVWRQIQQREDLNRAADRDLLLSKAGFRPTLARVLDVYGEGYEVVRPAAAPTPDDTEDYAEFREYAPLEIFRAGRHVASDGTVVEFSEADVAATAAAYDPEVHRAALVIGHPPTDEPAYGSVDRLELAAPLLLAHPADNVAPEFAAAVNAGRYPNKSACFFRPQSPKNPKPCVWYLKHVGFLGAAPPAVKGLKPARFAEDEDKTVTFVEHHDDHD